VEFVNGVVDVFTTVVVSVVDGGGKRVELVFYLLPLVSRSIRARLAGVSPAIGKAVSHGAE